MVVAVLRGRGHPSAAVETWAGGTWPMASGGRAGAESARPRGEGWGGRDCDASGAHPRRGWGRGGGYKTRGGARAAAEGAKLWPGAQRALYGDAGPGHRAVWRSERARLSLSSPPPQSQSSELPGPPEASVARPAVATSCTRPPHRSRPTRAPARPSAAPSPPPSRGSAAAAVPEQPVSTVGRRLGAEGGAAAPCEPGC